MLNLSSNFGIFADLQKHVQHNRPLNIAVIGCGEMGSDLVTQLSYIKGLNLCAVGDRKAERIFKAAEIANCNEKLTVEVYNAQQLSLAIESNKLAATEDIDLLLTHELIDIIIDATGSPDSGAHIGITAISHNKHLVSMNIETDVIIGSYLHHLATKAGVIYTLGAGDEPSACMELIHFVSSLQLPIICAGKGKNNPLNIEATPDLYEEEAIRRQMNPRMLVEFVDGSKTMVEMASLANATGLIPDCDGMHGPNAGIDDLAKVLIPQADGGILSRSGVVDYSIGSGVAPGVFVIAKATHPRILERMRDLKMGAGPYFTFFRPYHLTSLEVPMTCAKIALYNKGDMAPLDFPVAEVCAVAKKDLPANTTLDSIGEYCYRAWIMPYEKAKLVKAHPCGLMKGAKTTQPIKKGELLTINNVEINQSSPIVSVRKLHDIYLNERRTKIL